MKSAERAISAADANRNFSRLLRDVRTGRSYVVTSHGTPVAHILPIGRASRASTGADRSRAAARRTLLARLAAQPAVDIGRWTRDALYEDD
jgi:prevent-host-death family protein